MFQVRVRIEWTDDEGVAESVNVLTDACKLVGILEASGVPRDIALDVVHIHQSRIPYKSCQFQCLDWVVSVSMVL